MTDPPRVGDHADLSYAYESTPAGRTVEVRSAPDEYGMVRVRLVGDFYVSVDDIKLWRDR